MADDDVCVARKPGLRFRRVDDRPSTKADLSTLHFFHSVPRCQTNTRSRQNARTTRTPELVASFDSGKKTPGQRPSTGAVSLLRQTRCTRPSQRRSSPVRDCDASTNTMNFKGDFRYLGKADTRSLRARVLAIEEDEWNRNDWRQRQFQAHQHTRTVPLLFDADFRHSQPTAHPVLASLREFVVP